MFGLYSPFTAAWWGRTGWPARTRPAKLACAVPTLWRLPRTRDHLVGIYIDSERSAVEIRRGWRVFDCGPAFRIVADIDLDAVAVGSLIVETSRRPFVD